MTGATLAIRPRALGDVVLVTPALRALKRGSPGASLEVVTDPRYAPLLEGLEFVDRVWTLDRSFRATAALIATLRRRGIERVVDFFGNARTAAIAALCGARLRFGYDLRGRRAAYSLRVPRGLVTREQQYRDRQCVHGGQGARAPGSIHAQASGRACSSSAGSACGRMRGTAARCE